MPIFAQPSTGIAPESGEHHGKQKIRVYQTAFGGNRPTPGRETSLLSGRNRGPRNLRYTVRDQNFLRLQVVPGAPGSGSSRQIPHYERGRGPEGMYGTR